MTNQHPQTHAVGRTGLLFSILALLVLLAGCTMGPINSSSGTPIDSSKVAQIVKGKTTRAEVEALLGKPDQTSLVADGRRMMTYNYSATEAKSNNALVPWNLKATVSMRMQSLQIFLSKDNVVEDYELNDNTRNTQGDIMGRSQTTTH